MPTRAAQNLQLQCEVALLGPSTLAHLARPLFKTLSEITDDSPGARVEDLIAISRTQRQETVDHLFVEAEKLTPPIREFVRTQISSLNFTEKQQRRLDFAIEAYGQERVPTGPVPLPDDVYAIWKPRFREISILAPDNSQFGRLGEAVAATILPNITALQVSSTSLVSKSEWERMLKSLDDEDSAWLKELPSRNFEIDTVFGGDAYIGEIKFYKNQKNLETTVFARFEKQAKNLSRYLQILAKQGHKKTGIYIFLGQPPDTQLRSVLDKVNLDWIHIPIQ